MPESTSPIAREAGSTGPVAIVLTTIGAGADAAALARRLVEERLAACVAVLPAMTSVYRWQGRIEEESERQIVIKTSPDRVASLEARFKALHPYDVPEFLVLDATASQAYAAWLTRAVGHGPA